MSHGLQLLHEASVLLSKLLAAAGRVPRKGSRMWLCLAKRQLLPGHHIKKRSWCVLKAVDWASWDWDWPQTSGVTLGKSLSFSVSGLPLAKWR